MVGRDWLVRWVRAMAISIGPHCLSSSLCRWTTRVAMIGRPMQALTWRSEEARNVIR